MGPQSYLRVLALYVSFLGYADFLDSGHLDNSTHGRHLQKNMDSRSKNTQNDCINQTKARVVYPLCPNLRKPNFMWTDSITDRHFGIFRFGIGFNKNINQNHKIVRETSAPLMQVQGNEPVYVSVTAETNRSDVMLIIISCQLISRQNETKIYIIQDGCLNSRTEEERKVKYNKRVFSVRPFELPQVSLSSTVFLSCEVKLCLNTNHSRPCDFGCPVTLLVHQPIQSLLETETHHVTAKPIYVVQDSRKVVALNYTALVVGLVLGCTVVAVVVLLVRKSFSGVRHRTALVDL